MLTGFGALQDVMKDTASRGNFGGKLDYFNIDDGERIVVRFLTDDIITADFAERVRTADGKFQDFVIPDPSNNLVTRYMQPGAWDGKLKKKTIGVAVVREQQLVPSQDLTDPNARPTYNVVDKIITRDDGLQARIFLCVKQAHQNFWDQLVGFFGLYNTITDRDYVIVRQGKRLDTKYRIGPLDPAPNDPLRDPKVVAQTYGYGRPWDNEAQDRFMWCPKTLKEWYDDYGSESRVQHFLVGTPQAQGQAQPAAQAPQQQWAQAPVAPPQGYAPPQPAVSGYGPAFSAGVPQQAPPPQQPPAQYNVTAASQGQDPWGTPGQAPAQPAPNGPIGEFHPATTQNPVQPPAAPPAAPPAPQAQVAPAEDSDFSALRARMQGYARPDQQTT